jgi:hypothetical protein
MMDTGMTPESAAQLLHVTPRTIRYWISGRVTVPYAAYRLLRVMRLFELPMPGWEGWHMHSGKLWSPEGYGFTPQDSEWWSGLVRRARLFHQLYDRERSLTRALDKMTAGGQGTWTADPGSAEQPGPLAAAPVTLPAQRAGGEAGRPNLLLEHLTENISVTRKIQEISK